MEEVGVGSWNLFKIFNFVGHMAHIDVLIFTRDSYNSTQSMLNPPKFNLVTSDSQKLLLIYMEPNKIDY